MNRKPLSIEFSNSFRCFVSDLCIISITDFACCSNPDGPTSSTSDVDHVWLAQRTSRGPLFPYSCFTQNVLEGRKQLQRGATSESSLDIVVKNCFGDHLKVLCIKGNTAL